MNNFGILNNFDTCPNCGNIFAPLNSNMKFCTSEKCKQEVEEIIETVKEFIRENEGISRKEIIESGIIPKKSQRFVNAIIDSITYQPTSTEQGYYRNAMERDLSRVKKVNHSKLCDDLNEKYGK